MFWHEAQHVLPIQSGISRMSWALHIAAFRLFQQGRTPGLGKVCCRLVSPQGVNSTRQALRHANGWTALIIRRLA
jgi:hypothetical protein